MTSPNQSSMLIAFDGSAESRRALTLAARLLAPRRVEILTAWEPVHRTAARAVSISGLHQAEWVTDTEQEDAAYQQAQAACREGVNLAADLGLEARAHLVESETTTWSAICEAAQELRPDVIVTGSRGATGWRGFWQSSTTEGVLNNAGIPVFVVPPESEE
ncbi:MAG: universal stress protein [Corynebacterium sp.]|uniref:universal stress protein n=1 Tax=Corynebacterium sp. TaxID=1720 RepID=UPI0026DFA5D4|nr:universal stress protein [Corynebacterium sp.]MDO5670893.1 universal stress protein [Corynebacterium sp.]